MCRIVAYLTYLIRVVLVLMSRVDVVLIYATLHFITSESSVEFIISSNYVGALGFMHWTNLAVTCFAMELT
jgi:hypothetical protein